MSATLRFYYDKNSVFSQMRNIAITLIGLVIVSIALLIFISKYFGSIESAAMQLQGHMLKLPKTVEAIPGESDVTFQATITVESCAKDDIRLIGADACCGTKVKADFPIKLSYGEKTQVRVLIDAQRKNPLFLTLWVDTQGKLIKQRVVVVCRES
jgi:hypothetical protein